MFFLATRINFDTKIAILIFDPPKLRVLTLIVQIRHSALTLLERSQILAEIEQELFHLSFDSRFADEDLSVVNGLFATRAQIRVRSSAEISRRIANADLRRNAIIIFDLFSHTGSNICKTSKEKTYPLVHVDRHPGIQKRP